MPDSMIAPPVSGYLIQWVDVQAAFFAVAGVGLVTTALTALVVVEFADSAESSVTTGYWAGTVRDSPSVQPTWSWVTKL